jgi:hypothetical protein
VGASVRAEPHVPWLWQLAMAVSVLFLLGSMKPAPQVALVAAFALHPVLDRSLPRSQVAVAYRTFVLALTTALGLFLLPVTLSQWLLPPPEHPVMPVGEMLLGGLLAAVATILVLVLRIRGASTSSASESAASSQARAEPRLALVIDLFAIAAVVCVAVDRCG